MSQLCAWGDDRRMEQFLLKAHPADSGMLPPEWGPPCTGDRCKGARAAPPGFECIMTVRGCAVDDAVCLCG